MHIPLTDRKALAIRMIAARIFTNLPRLDKFAHAEYSQILDHINLYSKKADIELSPSVIEDFINNGAPYLEQNITISACNASSIALLKQFNALCDELRRFRCRLKINKENFCEGQCDNNDGHMFQNRGTCLDEAISTYDFIKAGALNFVDSIAWYARKPEMSLATGVVAFNDGFKISGSYNIKSDSIGVNFTQHTFDEEALFQLLYVIAHEAYCHGLQGILGNNRKAANPKCTWTEGFMDRVVFLHVQDFLTSDVNNIPSWLSHCRDKALGACHELHKNRNKKLAEKDSFAAYDRAYSWQVCDELNFAFRADSPNPATGTKKLFEFANLLNLKTVDRADRCKLLGVLTALFDERMRGTQMRHWTIRACKSFTLHSDLILFFNDIERISGETMIVSP